MWTGAQTQHHACGQGLPQRTGPDPETGEHLGAWQGDLGLVTPMTLMWAALEAGDPALDLPAHPSWPSGRTSPVCPWLLPMH